MNFKELGFILIVVMFILVPVTRAADDNKEENWKPIETWAGTIRAEHFEIISSTGLFGSSYGSQIVLIYFRINPENGKQIENWIEVKYEGSEGNTSKRLLYDEVNGFFEFPLTLVKLDGSGWSYPFDKYSTKIVVINENFSFDKDGRDLKNLQQRFLKGNISWENKTISLNIWRELNDLGALLFFIGAILIIFTLIFVASILFLKETKRKSGGKKPSNFKIVTFLTWLGRFSISFVTAMGSIYLVLAGFGVEAMPIPSIFFWLLFLYGIILTTRIPHKVGRQMITKIKKQLVKKPRHCSIEQCCLFFAPKFYRVLRGGEWAEED